MTTTRYNPPFEAIVKGNVLATHNPFRYVRTKATTWTNNDELFLKDYDTQFWRDSGEFQCIMLPQWEARFRILTENWGAFDGDSLKEALGDEMIAAHDIEFDDGFLVTSRWKASMTFTLRGDGMFGVWVDGASPDEVWGEDAFDDEVRVRLGNASNPTIFNNGFFFSFTHPFGDYNDTSTFTLKVNEVDDETKIQLLSIAEIAGVNTRPVDSTTENMPISIEDILDGERKIYDSGTSQITGLSWIVEGVYFSNPNSGSETWWVLTNGEIIEFYGSEAEADARAIREIARAKRDADWIDTDPTPDLDDETSTAALLALVGYFALIGIVALSIFRK
jgi:hypothetical protein